MPSDLSSAGIISEALTCRGTLTACKKTSGSMIELVFFCLYNQGTFFGDMKIFVCIVHL